MSRKAYEFVEGMFWLSAIVITCLWDSLVDSITDAINVHRLNALIGDSQETPRASDGLGSDKDDELQ